MSTTSAPKKITLKTNDDEVFELTEAEASESITIRSMIEDDCANTVIPIANVDGKTLALVVEYIKKHVESRGDDADNKTVSDDLRAWDAKFIKFDHHNTLFNIVLAANYLDIKDLLELACQTVANMIKDKPVEEVRQFFNITNDFTPEEEAEVRKENQWAFE